MVAVTPDFTFLPVTTTQGPTATATTATIGVSVDQVAPSGPDGTSVAPNIGVIVAVVFGAYVVGRIQQYLRDEKRGLGPTLSGRGKQRD